MQRVSRGLHAGEWVEWGNKRMRGEGAGNQLTGEASTEMAESGENLESLKQLRLTFG